MTQARRPAEQNRLKRFFGDWEMEAVFISSEALFPFPSCLFGGSFFLLRNVTQDGKELYDTNPIEGPLYVLPVHARGQLSCRL